VVRSGKGGTAKVRWEALFADLEARGVALGQAELDAEVAERTRGEVGALGVLDRARAAVGGQLLLRLAGGLVLRGRLAQAGPGWLLVDEDAGREALVASERLISVRGFGRRAAAPGSAGVVESRIGIRQLLRAVARDRSQVGIHLVDGSVLDATIDRVGADFIDVAAHPPGEPRERAGGPERLLVVISAIAAVRRSV
jgi:hypothetical protein